MKTIGVLGGLGPQATMDFEARVHACSQRLLAPRRSGGYPPMLVYYYRHSPFLLTPDWKLAVPLQPHPRLLESARRLSTWADFLVVTANAPHLFIDQIQRAFGGPVLSLITVTLTEAERRGLKRIGVIGLGEPNVYLQPLAERGLSAIVLPESARSNLDEAIFAMMEGRSGAESRQVARNAIGLMRSCPVDGIILGCTEIPLLLGESADDGDLINPAHLLAESAVRYAIS